MSEICGVEGELVTKKFERNTFFGMKLDRDIVKWADKWQTNDKFSNKFNVEKKGNKKRKLNDESFSTNTVPTTLSSTPGKSSNSQSNVSAQSRFVPCGIITVEDTGVTSFFSNEGTASVVISLGTPACQMEGSLTWEEEYNHVTIEFSYVPTQKIHSLLDIPEVLNKKKIKTLC